MMIRHQSHQMRGQHEKESPTFTYSLEPERLALQATKKHREVPDKANNTLLAATWNLTNFGVQERTDDDIALMAEIVSWFDLVAVQEVADELTDLRRLVSNLESNYKVILSDIGGNNERAGFIYESNKVERLELAAEVAEPPSQRRFIRIGRCIRIVRRL